RMESPTRSLFMEAPKGIEILAEAGNIQATCRNEMRLESKDGEVYPSTAQRHAVTLSADPEVVVLKVFWTVIQFAKGYSRPPIANNHFSL
ncbi:SGCD protein, partial [Polypterus senegalus]